MNPESKVQTFLWFQDGLEEALAFYTATFGDVRINEMERMPDGTLFTADFHIFDREFIGMCMRYDEGPRFNDSISIMIQCEDQAEIDRYWDAITAEGEAIACGWCRDKWGVTWQIVPRNLREFLGHPDAAKRDAINAHFRTMRKIVIDELAALA